MSTHESGTTPDIGTIMSASPVMALFRGMDAAPAVELAQRAWDVGIALVEVPIQEERYLPALEAVVAAGRERGLLVGAGTITTSDRVDAVARAGAAFTIAPGLDPDVVAASRAAGLPHLPGVATASEIQRAVALGCTWVKAFPASLLTPSWFRAMHGPFPQVRFVATGGIDASNAEEFLDGGASTVAVGSALADRSQVDRLADVIARRS
ncbi:KDPG and KHG aldolase [Beutenbergia cavernae DSM 12333]|uniref:KDPG and KHG aldolase n=1 Tax=Beutenbergia cavernae (strain ATCC BAA-8 / DSM 12333 / CCUG 43141 / JCM 11478 / NBRC 16432 / NCIMB 13614 / HKI 0122) TaxID=471853 RepID=C5C3X0_BEUC1|nr:bifunctional 4-hydroxy-2-oxoglutarate aldolase/2-dehydro-3-deoxy-phosphogluconate aldolase [Beutenbergia cavernae]ACQ79883.1 KDPG and KHG aldolase [Beutenbergia cavernae DSM 12333]